jgi:hypothetical protein
VVSIRVLAVAAAHPDCGHSQHAMIVWAVVIVGVLKPRTFSSREKQVA